MAPFYTAKGDQGDTGFLGEGRISKSSLRIEAVGSVDEATAALGLARALAHDEKTRGILLHIQKKLYQLMSELSADPKVAHQFDQISDEDVKWLEEQVEWLEKQVIMPREFIIPGEGPSSGALALARTIVRRAERRATALLEAEQIQKTVLIAYLNRLSSLIFVLEIYETALSGGDIRLAKDQL